jgi:hypothetical protein
MTHGQGARSLGQFLSLLGEPFAVRILDELREVTRMEIGAWIDLSHAVECVRRFEPHVLWNEKFLRYRPETYKAQGDPLPVQARKELDGFLQAQGRSWHGLRFWF